MRTDTEWIELYLDQKISGEEKASLDFRMSHDPLFKQNLWVQAKIQLIALMYGRSLRRTRILAASEAAFSDPLFKEQINAIFR